MPTLRSCRILAVVATFVGFAPAAFAGPPLICHPFVVDSASPLLPWAAGREWRLPHPDYDVASLTADTLALLSVDAPILVADGEPAPRDDLRGPGPGGCRSVARGRSGTHRRRRRPIAHVAGARVVRCRLPRRDVSTARSRLPARNAATQRPRSAAGIRGGRGPRRLCVHPKGTRARARAARRARFRCVIDDAGAVGRDASPPSRHGRRNQVRCSRAISSCTQSSSAAPTLRSFGIDVAS